jgi:predicted dinucleotide-binding enzyme
MMGSSSSSEETPDLSSEFDGTVIGVLGTGDMASAHAARWSAYNIPVCIGSRDKARGAALASRINRPCVSGGTQEEMLEKSTIVLMCLHPGPISADFVEKNKAALEGKGVVDMTASYTRFYSQKDRPPEPFQDHLTWMQSIQGGNATWCKAFSHVMASSIRNNKRQPMEITGDGYAKQVVTGLLNAAGWEVLDCGDSSMTKTIEGRGPARKPHPRYVEFNGPNAP